MPWSMLVASAVMLFQSAPGREAGRCQHLRRVRIRNNRFQSAPGREAGRCIAPCWSTPPFVSFNPRPAVRPGDAFRYAGINHA